MPGRDGRGGDGVAHLPAGGVGDETNRVNGFAGGAGGDENAFVIADFQFPIAD